MDRLSPEVRQALDAAMQLALQRHQSGDLPAAEALYAKVLGADPQHPVALHNLGLIRLSRGDTEAALTLLGAAVQASPREPVFHFNLGLAEQTVGHRSGAVQAYRAAVGLKADYLKAWENLGVVLQEQEQYDAAIDAYRQALRVEPASPIAHQNLGNVLRVVGRIDEAEAQYRKALDINPLYTDVALQYGTARLSRGDFSAWRTYEWRYWSPDWLAADRPVPVLLPKWDGGELRGRGLLLYGEQGIGDEIQFAALVPRAAALAERTVLLCEPRLVPLFARSFPGIAVAARPPAGQPPVLDPGDPCELRCALPSLPACLGLTAADLTGASWLRADATAGARWRERLAALGGRLTLGLSWRGGARPHAREARSIPLQALAPLFAVPGVRFVNLQYGAHADEIAQFNQQAPAPLTCFEDVDPLRDMDGFAALLSALDGVITVDNSTVHLAGALGVPAWLLCPFHADWRWTRGREDSLWYRSVRLFWQAASGSGAWAEVISRVAALLPQFPVRTALPAVPPASPAAPDAVAPPPVAPDVLLLNDTAYWYHWGCTGTSLALHAALREAGLSVDSVSIVDIQALEPLPASPAALDDEALFRAFRARHPALLARIEAVSQVVVNGEGSIHGLGTMPRALLYLAYLAKRRFGKPTRIINHSGYPTSDGSPSELAEAFYRKVYQALDFVAVREDLSAAALAQLGVETVQAFDCLPLFIARHPPRAAPRPSRRVVIAGSVMPGAAFVNLLVWLAATLHAQGYAIQILVGANAYLAADDVQLLAQLHPRLRGRYELVAATSEQQWLDALAGADLLVSGRFHHSIAAACVGTPFVVAASNTRKIEGLIQRLGLSPDDVWVSPADPAQAATRVARLLGEPQRGRVADATLDHLRALARRNFLDL